MIKVVFFIDRGKRKRTDRRTPYKTRIRVTFKRGSKHRVHARIYFRRKGQRVQRKRCPSVHMCGSSVRALPGHGMPGPAL